MLKDVSTAIRQITDTNIAQSIRILQCNVVSVDTLNRSCVVSVQSGEGNYQIENVELMAGINDGLLLIPSVDSLVYVLISKWIDKPFIIQYSLLDKIIFNGGMYQGQTSPMVEINKLISVLNNLISIFNSHTHVVPNGTSNAPTQQQTTTTVNQLQNENITQG